MRKPFFRRSRNCWYVKNDAGKFIRLDPDETRAQLMFAAMLERNRIDSVNPSILSSFEAFMEEHEPEKSPARFKMLRGIAEKFCFHFGITTVWNTITQYAQTLFVDADDIIRQSCPNLFEAFEGADVVMHDDYRFHVPPIAPSWAEPDHDHTMRSQDIDIKWSGRMWNSGIVLTSRQAASIWSPPPKRLPDTGVSEQWWVQFQAECNFNVTDLPSELNWQYWFPSFADGTDSAEIVHASGTRNKLEIPKRFV